MTPDEPTGPDVEYDPMPEILAEGDILVLDPVDFENAFDCYLVCNRGGQAFVLKKATRKWESVESDDKPRGGLRSMK